MNGLSSHLTSFDEIGTAAGCTKYPGSTLRFVSGTAYPECLHIAVVSQIQGYIDGTYALSPESDFSGALNFITDWPDNVINFVYRSLIRC